MVSKSIIYSIIGLFAYSQYKRKLNYVNVYYVDSMPNSYNGMSIPPFGVFIDKSEKDNDVLLAHELIHWNQFRREGMMMLPRYILETWKNGYDKNKYEIEAFQNEDKYCRKHYTECVRSGVAKTVYNPNFRK